MTNIADILEGCRSYPSDSWAVLLERLVIETVPSLRQAYTLPVVKFLATLHIQNETTLNAGIEKWGFSELLDRLSELPETKILRIEEFDIKEFVVRCVFIGDSTTLLGCTIVKKRQRVMQTPPAWNGSLEALEKFNNPPDD